MVPRRVQAGTGPDPSALPSPTLLTPGGSLCMLTGKGGGAGQGGLPGGQKGAGGGALVGTDWAAEMQCGIGGRLGLGGSGAQDLCIRLRSLG